MQDRGAYMAGQSAALMEAFKLALPNQQALGSMGSGLQRLQAQVRDPVQGQLNMIMKPVKQPCTIIISCASVLEYISHIK
jgi:hypothetical protein